MFFVPPNGLAQPRFKWNQRFPAEFLFHLLTIKSIAPVMPRPVLYVMEKRFGFSRKAQDVTRNRNIFFDVEPADVVNLANLSPVENCENGATVVFDMQPIALLLPVAINRELFVVESIGDQQGEKLFGKLIW